MKRTAQQHRSISRRSFRSTILLALVASLACAGGALASIVGLPASGAQVNSDSPAIDPTQNAGLSDLTAGSLVAGNARVPWIAFSQANADGSQQIFVRAFKGGAWQTEGFPQSLNEDDTQVAQAPSIDFTGAGRTVPWVAWAEPSSTFAGVSQIFASRFSPQPAPAENGGQWIHEGQGRTGNVPSLNINTGREAADPSLIGGTTTAGGNPAPWITWEEADNGNTAKPSSVGGASRFQIFVSHAVAASSGACPAGTKPAGPTSVGNFCFQQVGIDRVQGPGSLKDPSLNVDPTRDGIEADIAFTGANDTVPWVVWYENSDDGNVTDGLLNADMVFAARGIADAAGDGGFHWQVVGLGTAGKTATDDVLDAGASGHGPFGECATTQAAEEACSLDADAAAAPSLSDGNGAENPEVTAGTMVPGKATTPWVAWDESNVDNGQHSIFVARLDAAGDHFDLLNNGQAISNSGFDSTRPDIVFSGNTPYVSWHEANGSETLTFVGHFEGNPADPVFHIDTPAGIVTTTPGPNSDDDLTDVRQPIASTCPDDPFTEDGSACPGSAVGTPFFAFTNTTNGPRELFVQSYQPDNVQTDTASGVGVGTATLSGSVDPAGAPVQVQIQYGPTTSYGSSTAVQSIAPGENQTPFSAAVTGLPSGTLHYRAVAISDFGTFPGADQTVAIPVTMNHPTPVPTFGLHISSPRGNVKANKLKAVSGTASASLGIAKVQVAVVEFSGGARVASAHGKRPTPACEQLGGDGRLHKLTVGRHSICTATIFLTASGTTKWSLKLTRHLPKGTYEVVGRVIDHASHISGLTLAGFRVV
ncbi:MAG: hypothetical protein ACLP01_27540 [Solirubrobacteraceae bacterium]